MTPRSVTTWNRCVLRVCVCVCVSTCIVYHWMHAMYHACAVRIDSLATLLVHGQYCVGLPAFAYNRMLGSVRASQVPSFKELPWELRLQLSRALLPQSYNRGELIVRQGDVPHAM